MSKYDSLWVAVAGARSAENSGKHRPRCAECGFKIRGKNHEAGAHHAQGRTPSNRGQSTGK